LILSVQLGVLLLAVPMYWAAGLTFKWSSVGGQLFIAGVFCAGAALSRRDQNGVPQAMFAITLLLTAWLILGPLQYLAAAWNRPLVDAHLLRADAWLGVSPPAIDRWMAGHAMARHVLGLAYVSLLPQFVLVPIVLGWLNRTRLWQFVLQFELTAICTVVLFAWWPASTPAQHGVHEWVSQADAMQQLFAVRSGALRVLDLTQATGLISWPSFHTSGALLVVWSLRKTWWFWPIVLLDGLLIAATVLLGVHYAVDVLGGIGVVGLVVMSTEYLTNPRTSNVRARRSASWFLRPCAAMSRPPLDRRVPSR
jgi:membrane-associated phospholipid phosphatase